MFVCSIQARERWKVNSAKFKGKSNNFEKKLSVTKINSVSERRKITKKIEYSRGLRLLYINLNYFLLL